MGLGMVIIAVDFAFLLFRPLMVWRFGHLPQLMRGEKENAREGEVHLGGGAAAGKVSLGKRSKKKDKEAGGAAAKDAAAAKAAPAADAAAAPAA